MFLFVMHDSVQSGQEESCSHLNQATQDESSYEDGDFIVKATTTPCFNTLVDRTGSVRISKASS
jgi:hypothetical protein